MTWISVNNALPPSEMLVFCCDVYSGFVSLGRYIEYEDFFELMAMTELEADSMPTHWMHLPELPEVENEF